MNDLRRVQRSGIEAVEAITALLQRRRLAHPTKGLYEAAELQFWWSVPRRTDEFNQLFWVDADGQPVAAAALFDFSSASSLVYDEVIFCPFALPDATPAFLTEVVEAGLALANNQGFDTVELEVEQSDEIMQAVLTSRGFAVKEQAVLIECWLDCARRPEVSPLPEGYRFASRAAITDRPHYLGRRNSDFDEARLIEVSLYRSDLDLVVIDSDDNDAGHCLCWFDPVTLTGVVEPMRVNDEHQQRGLARHLLTMGVDLLAQIGATRVSIGYEPDNPASGRLYRSVGFQDTQRNDLYSGPTSDQR